MTHRFPIKEVARQAGLGVATVDRVLHDRPNVSPQSRARVRAAIAELEGQESQLAAKGRRLFVDLIIEAPRRFSDEVRRAAEAVLPSIGPAVFRPRFLCQEVMQEAEICAALARVAKRGSHGVCLKARDLPGIRDAVNRLIAAGIPVVTLVTDLPGSDRTAYRGLDNLNAGRMAAYLMGQVLGAARGAVLTSQSQHAFFGEDERAAGFRDGMARHCPGVALIDASGGGGLGQDTQAVVTRALSGIAPVLGAYSMGGGNRAILDVLEDLGHNPQIFVTHDLDVENRALLAAGRISFVLFHDLRADMRNVFLRLARHHRLVGTEEGPAMSDVQIITPVNIPA